MQKLLFTLHVQKLLKKSNSVDSVLTKWISMSNKNKPTLVLNLTRRNWLGYTIINSCKSQSVLVLKCLFHLLTEWKATSRILLVLYWRKNYQDLYKAGTKNGILKDLFPGKKSDSTFKTLKAIYIRSLSEFRRDPFSYIFERGPFYSWRS